MATYTWTSDVSGDWNTGTLWSDGTIPNSATADVSIDATGTAGSYTVTIASGESEIVNTLTLNGVNNVLNVLANPYAGAVLEVDGTLTFAPGSAGTIDGPLQSFMIVDGGTIVNAGTVNAFVQDSNNVLFTGTNGFYITNWLQSFGTTTIDTSSIAEKTGNTLFDGIFEAAGSVAAINFGGTIEGMIVNIATVEGPPIVVGAPFVGWTELYLEGPGSSINEWNGSAYVPLESTLTTIQSRGTVDVLQGRDYTTTNTLTIAGGRLNLQGGTVTTAGITIASGGTIDGEVTGSATIVGPVTNDTTMVSVDSGLVLTGTLDGTGIVTFGTGAATLEVGAVGAGQTIDMLGSDTLKLDTPAAFFGTISATIGDTIDLGGIVADGATVVGSDLVITNAGSTVATLHMAGSYAGDAFNVGSITGGSGISIAAAVCYARGTRIMTPDGEVPIEQLQPGQEVVTASGETAPVVWIGHRSVDLTRHPEPDLAQPVRIKAGAFGNSLPRRDLVVSPAHAIFDEGVLIPARFLVNGRNVVQEDVARVEYFHVELQRHDVVLAEGLPAESYLENNDRNRFENSGGAVALHPDFASWNWDGRACADLVVTGPAFEAVQAKLARTAERPARAPRRRAA
ncbi:MAG: Hint domain-containing protein [Acetobacteraceae bacterium]|nr:Hint domain-containing protein [Acetobacteraceae bacterium]